MKKHNFSHVIYALLVCLIVCSDSTLAQDSSNLPGSRYISEADRALTIQKISLLPVTDNLQGIYSRPVEDELSKFLDKNHHFDFVKTTTLGPSMSPDEIASSPSKIKKISQGISADAFIVAQVIKGPNGVTLKMKMFLTNDSQLFSEIEESEIKRFEVDEIRGRAKKNLSKLLSKIPYDGLVLSRNGQRVTVNLGKSDGIAQGQVVSVVQIIKVNRHPHFNFLINTEKEILGKIKILKVDDTLSFGTIVTERERGTIQVSSKLSGLDFVKYNLDESLSGQSGADKLQQRTDSKTSFGKGAFEWLPQKPPTFGQVGASIGFGSYTGNIMTSSALETKAPFYPLISLHGELWLTPLWSIHTNIKQGILSVDNPSGGSPSSLSQSLSANDLLVSYNIRMSQGVWGPKVGLFAGYANYKLFIDDTSVTGLTTKSYSGLKLGVNGSYPLTPDEKWNLGANLFLFFSPNLVESPSSSGTSDNSINQFGAFIDYKLGMNLKIRGAVDFELYSSSFSGSTVSSSSQKHTLFTSGIYYLF